MKYSLLLFTLFLIQVTLAGIPDSVRIEIENIDSDTAKISALYTHGLHAVDSDSANVLNYANSMLKIASKKDHFALARAYKLKAYYNHFVNLQADSAYFYYSKARDYFLKIKDEYEAGYLTEYAADSYIQELNYRRAFELYKEAKSYYEKSNSVEAIANTYNSLAVCTNHLGDLAGALDFYGKALKIYNSINDTSGISIAKMNMGLLLMDAKNYRRSIDLQLESLRLRIAMNNPSYVAKGMQNLGVTYKEIDMLDSAFYYADSAQKIREQIGDLYGYLESTDLLGAIAFRKKDYHRARLHWQTSLDLREQFKINDRLFSSYVNLAWLDGKEGNYSRAEGFLDKAMNIAEQANDLEWMSVAHHGLAELYAFKGDYKSAYSSLSQHKLLSDSLLNRQTQQDIIRSETAYWFKNQMVQDSLRSAAERKELEYKNAQDKLKSDAEIKRQRLYIMFGSGILILLVAVSILFYRNARNRKRANAIIRKQKEEVELQKDLVEEKNREILDSINYAKRLQEAILPPTRVVKEWLPQSFILYKPKDIVAGDFYWMETIGDTVYFAAADCTGHGVPGAMVSVVCSNALSKALVEEGRTMPGELLDRARELVIDRFGRSEEEIKDGMDISLCALNVKTNELLWAGANNPLWILRNDSNEFEEIKADKQPIGKFRDAKPFTNHSIQLKTGDAIYIFTDGYADQFGGTKGKKFKAANLKDLILKNRELAMDRQRTLLSRTFEEWRGDLEQIDDVCVLGVRI